MHARARQPMLLIALAFALVAGRAGAGTVDAVEFHHAVFDHYFVTASAEEIGKLDSGFFTGWMRTGLSFKVLEPSDTSLSALPVCRYYGNPAAGLDSHFYSASATECDEVKQKFPNAWLLESSNVFQIYLPDLMTGACAPNTVPVYRSWNNRTDSNHRYTTSVVAHDAMVAKGYVAEGYGTGLRPVAMCAPAPAGAIRPACTLTSDRTTANVGSTISLTASCSGAPTSYSWTGCASTGPLCTASASSPGIVVYSVVATNANGPGAPATAQVTWAAPPPEPPPVCSIVVNAQHQMPVVNTVVVLEASCNGSPTAYQWTNCVSVSNICKVRASVAGPVTYQLSASSSGGFGTPVTANVNWITSPPPPVGLCGAYPSTLHTEIGSTNAVAHTLFNDPPAFAWDGVWAIRFTVPATAAPSAFGTLGVAEFGAPGTYRQATVSRTACDFRPRDLTGAAGPLGVGVGNTAVISLTIGASTATLAGLVAGDTYYFNVRNFLPGPDTITCPSSPGRCDAIANISQPR